MKEKDLVEAFKNFLIEKKGFPPNLLSTERHLKHFSGRGDLCSRFDLMSFFISGEYLKPLVIFELKRSDRFIQPAVGQVISYNRIINSPFMCVSTPGFVLSASSQKDLLKMESKSFVIYGIKWFLGIPNFDELVLLVSKKKLAE